MGGSADELTREEAQRLLRWWLDAGVDTAISEAPRDWLKSGAARSPAVPAELAPPDAVTDDNAISEGEVKEVRDFRRHGADRHDRGSMTNADAVVRLTGGAEPLEHVISCS